MPIIALDSLSPALGYELHMLTVWCLAPKGAHEFSFLRPPDTHTHTPHETLARALKEQHKSPKLAA